MVSHEELYTRALRVIPGGVNSPVRAFNSVGGTPIYVTEGKGSRITTADGRTLTDFCCSWGAMILGHADPVVTEAVCTAAAKGSTFGINTPGEVDFAEMICERTAPFVERVRLVNSGTEAVMTALRLARGITGRPKILKFDGCYHGHSDAMLVAAGSGVLTAGEADKDGFFKAVAATKGIPAEVADDVFVVPYNDADAVREVMARHGETIAAIIVEPVAGNMGCVAPEPGFLQTLREEATAYGALLIFDEVINGFRFHNGLYASLCGVAPDLVTMGKVIGGGLPLAAVGGNAAYMNQLAPAGEIYQAGTLSGNPVAVAAGAATLRALSERNPYPEMIRLCENLTERVNAAARRLNAPLRIARAYGVFTPFCTTQPVRTLAEAKQADLAFYGRFFHGMLSRGFYIEPSQFEVCFISAAHTQADIDAFAAAAEETLEELSHCYT